MTADFELRARAADKDGLGASPRPAAASLPAQPRDRRPAGFAVMFQASSSARALTLGRVAARAGGSHPRLEGCSRWRILTAEWQETLQSSRAHPLHQSCFLGPQAGTQWVREGPCSPGFKSSPLWTWMASHGGSSELNVPPSFGAWGLHKVTRAELRARACPTLHTQEQLPWASNLLSSQGRGELQKPFRTPPKRRGLTLQVLTAPRTAVVAGVSGRAPPWGGLSGSVRQPPSSRLRAGTGSPWRAGGVRAAEEVACAACREEGVTLPHAGGGGLGHDQDLELYFPEKCLRFGYIS